MGDLERRRRRLADSIDTPERDRIGGQHAADIMKFPQQRLGDWFRIAPRYRGRQQIFDQFMVEQSTAAQ